MTSFIYLFIERDIANRSLAIFKALQFSITAFQRYQIVHEFHVTAHACFTVCDIHIYVQICLNWIGEESLKENTAMNKNVRGALLPRNCEIYLFIWMNNIARRKYLLWNIWADTAADKRRVAQQRKRNDRPQTLLGILRYRVYTRFFLPPIQTNTNEPLSIKLIAQREYLRFRADNNHGIVIIEL